MRGFMSFVPPIMLTHGDTPDEALLGELPRMNIAGPPENYEGPKTLGADRTTVLSETKIYKPQPRTITDRDFIDIHDQVVRIRTALMAIRGRTAGESVAIDYLRAAQEATDVNSKCMEYAVRIRLTDDALVKSLHVLKKPATSRPKFSTCSKPATNTPANNRHALDG